MKKEFEALYNLMANSQKVEYMHTFGKVHKEMFQWFVVNKPELAQEWLEKLESIRWNNYLSAKEAEKIIAGMNPKAPWTFDQWKVAMAYTRITAAEAAALIKNGENIAMSGFTPAGVAKATTKELAKIAVAEHEAGREFKVGIFTGASTGQSTDGDLANAQAIKYRAPYTTNPDFRKHVNMGEIPYNDLHLSHMAQELRYGLKYAVSFVACTD